MRTKAISYWLSVIGVVLTSVFGPLTSAHGQAYSLTPGGLATTDIDTSAELAAILGDETGTGVFVLNLSPALTTPKIITGLFDANNNSMLAFTPTASAVDGFTFTNAATANPATVTMAATGSDSNITLQINAKGSGDIKLGTNGTKVNSSGSVLASNGTDVTYMAATGIFLPASRMLKFTAHPDGATSNDLGVGRNGVSIAEINNGTAISGTSNAGSIKALAFIPAGTATSCTGATIGTGSKSNAGFATATTTGVSTIVITFPVTAPTGWSVMCSNITNAATLIQQTAKSPTTATLTGTTASGDVIQYIAMPY